MASLVLSLGNAVFEGSHAVMWMQPRYFVVLLLVGAFSLRLGTVLAFRDIHEGPTGGIGNDDVQFNQLALNLVNGYGYRVTPDRPLASFRAPGFPFVLGALYAITGESPPAAYLLFCLLGGAACVLTYFLGREVLTETGGRVAGLLAALYFPHVYMATNFISENVYVPVLALGVWLFVRFMKQGGGRLIAVAGLALGWATLTRPGSLLLLPLLLGVLT